MIDSIFCNLDAPSIERDYIFLDPSLFMPTKKAELFTLPVDVKQLNNGRADKRQSLALKGCFILGSIFAPDVIPYGGGILRIDGFFMIDTGADHCAMRQEVVTQMNLRKYDVRENIGINRQKEIKPLYKIQIAIPDAGLIVPVEKVVTTKSLAMYGRLCIGIIGRDILAYCQFHYDGVTGDVTLEYDDTVPLTSLI
jgi:hypothetical protein